MSYHGDITLGDTIHILFNTRGGSPVVPTNLTGGTVVAYVGASGTPVSAGITLTAPFASTTGMNLVTIVASSGNGFTAGTNVALILSAGTVGGNTVVGEKVGSFSIQNRPQSLRAGAVNTTSLADATLTAAKYAANAITSTVIADDAITAAKIATDAIGASEVSTAAAAKIADSQLVRDWTLVTDPGGTVRNMLNALRTLRNKVSISGTTESVFKEDDTTVAYTSTLTAAPGADPISARDPA
jgi:hypothetical protein